MSQKEISSLINSILKESREAVDTAKTASRNGKSLSGHNFYGEKFHKRVIEISVLQSKLGKDLRELVGDDEVRNLTTLVSTIKSEASPVRSKVEALKGLNLLCSATIIPTIDSAVIVSTPKSEQVLPNAVVQPANRGYLTNIVLQANGSYENGWYDACSVMTRKLVEILIIELYEAKGKADDIKKDGNFLMLSGLIDKILTQTYWNLQRETKTALPKIKSLGDHSAHNRRYVCTKPDVDKLLPGLRIIVDDLLHLSGFK